MIHAEGQLSLASHELLVRELLLAGVLMNHNAPGVGLL